jgi:hypothetical protein
MLVHPDGSELITLNPVGTIVWEVLAHGVDTAALTDAIATRFAEVPREDLERDCAAFIKELDELGLIVADDAAG